jgi:hypothetical protein
VKATDVLIFMRTRPRREASCFDVAEAFGVSLYSARGALAALARSASVRPVSDRDDRGWTIYALVSPRRIPPGDIRAA